MSARRLRDRLLRRRVLLPIAAVLVGLLVFVFVWFQPHKLFIDDTVDDPAPVGAVPIAAAPAPTSIVPTTTTSVPTTTTTSPTTTTIAVAAAPVTTAVSPSTTTPASTTSTTTTPATTTTLPPPPPFAEFISRDHGTSGRAVFLRDPGGVVYLRLEALDTDNGPDLYVYLTVNPADGPEQAFDDDYVSLGRLQGNKGDQNYVVPDGTDLSRYTTVVIWCDRFNSAFGAATFVV